MKEKVFTLYEEIIFNKENLKRSTIFVSLTSNTDGPLS